MARPRECPPCGCLPLWRPAPRTACSVDPSVLMVYYRCMTRTNIDIDDEACRRVMERFNLSTKREAVNLALRRMAAEALDLDEARSLRGSGWVGDLATMRTDRAR